MNKLFLLPHAGGSSTLFRRWERSINCEVIKLDYPGHWIRSKENLIKNFDLLVEDMTQIIMLKSNPTDRLYIFGHSLGAILSRHIAHKLVKEGYCIERLFISSSESPNCFPEESIKNIINDEDLLGLIGIDVASKNEESYMGIISILKNDLELCKSYNYNTCPYQSIKSTIMWGNTDWMLQEKNIKKWDSFLNVTDFICLKGDHFYLTEAKNIEIISDYINSILSK